MKKLSKDYFIIPIFVPHLGCPHDCIFCNQRKITGLSTNIQANDVKNTIEEHLATFPKGPINIEVAFYGGSFTGIDKTDQENLLAIPHKYKEAGIIHGIRLSTRPDYIDKDILDLLKKYGVDTIELGVQSLDEEVLKESYRGHSVEDVYRASKLIKEYDFNLGLQMMVGLVKDTREKVIYTAKEFVKLDPYCVRIYPTLVIKDTYLEKMYADKKYTPLQVEEAVDIVTDILMLFEYNDINVIRVGLQPTENIQLGKDVVAGPFHPSIRQLVESNIYKNLLENYLKNFDRVLIEGETMILKANEKSISNISGQKSFNINYLIEKFKFKKIKIYGEDLPIDILKIQIGEREDILDRRKAIERFLCEKGILEF